MRRQVTTLLASAKSARERLLPPITAPLVVIDDVFPNVRSGFRVGEFNSYLRAFPDAMVASTPHWWPTSGGDVGFDASLSQYRAHYPDLADRIVELRPGRRLRADLAYGIFLNNIDSIAERLEHSSVPFVFTLYPGGGLELDQPAVDDRLRRVLGSSMCQGVITTQRVTYEYLRSKDLVEPERVTHVFGVVLPDLVPPHLARRRFGYDKDTLDVVFAANRYRPDGHDKGYDVFLGAARLAAAERSDLRFHVVGGHMPSDLPIDGLEDRLTFHGVLPGGSLTDLLQRCDVSISPNRPFVLSPGGFDGFPTTTSVLAGLCGSCVLASDELGEGAFVDGTDLIVVRPDPEEIAARLLSLTDEPAAIAQLGEAARVAFSAVYSDEAQMTPRIALLRHHLTRR